MKLISPYISLSDSVRIRKEYFGGIIFNTSTGTVIEVSRKAYTLISIIQANGVTDVNDLNQIWFNLFAKHLHPKTVSKNIKKLIELNVLVVMPQGILHQTDKDGLFQKEQFNTWPAQNHLSAPETLHWAVTYNCDAKCPDCYIERHKHTISSELNTKQILQVLDMIAAAGVFQLAIGGGEPFLREDLATIAAGANERKLVVHITTGRYEHEISVIREIARSIKSIQVGIKNDELIKQPVTEKEKLTKLVNLLNSEGIDVGANLIISLSTIKNFDRIIKLLSEAGFQRITLLRYKPPGNLKRWMQEKPDQDALQLFEVILTGIVAKYPHIQFRVDCGLTFLQRKLPSHQALQSGIRGCVAADRILSVAPDGTVYPCSQLVGEQFLAGSLLEDDFSNIWDSKVINKYRGFRTTKTFKTGHCGYCQAKSHCGGCRVFAEDALGTDPGCPDPILPPSKRPKFSYDRNETIMDIQESIGFTSGGYPFATFEEIKGWLEEESYCDYPLWLLNNNRRRDLV